MPSRDVFEGFPEEDLVSPTADLFKSTKIEDIRFPLDIGKNNHPLMTYRIVKYNRDSRTEASKKDTIVAIHLPIPANLTVAYGALYSNVELGLGGNVIRNNKNLTGAASELLRGSASSALSNATDLGSTDLGALGSAISTGFARNIIQKVGEVTNTKAIEAAQIASGLSINPHLAALFETVGFRSHSFSYKFVAKNVQESNVIRRMISVLKYAMHPGIEAESGGNLFSFPEQFFIRFADDYRPYLYDFRPCVLANMTVNYNGSGIPTFFQDTNAPVDITIDMQFNETEIVTKESIAEEINSQKITRRT
jgi:hypothetical protein